MSETIVQATILVFAAGIVGFVIGLVIARVTGPGAPADEASPEAASAARQGPPGASAVAPSPAAEAPSAEEPEEAAAAAPEPVAGPSAPGSEPVSVETRAAPPAAEPPAAEPARAPEPPAAEPEREAEPEPAAPAAGEPGRPPALAGPRAAGADDLKKIKGVGPKIEATLNSLGIYHFDQIAQWTPDNIAWVDDHLKFRGRIGREDWVEQAKSLAGS